MLNIFNLKLKNSNYDKPDNKGNEIGQTRHYPPANKEWFNSIYAYNKNTIKLLPIADKVILRLVKSYFNLYSRKLEKKIKSRRLRMRVRRLSTNRILVSRAELKHTNDKVVITLYVYNRQKKYYLNKINKIAIYNLLEQREKKLFRFALKNSYYVFKKAGVDKSKSLDMTKFLKKLQDDIENLKEKEYNVLKQSLRIVSKVTKHKNILFKTLNWNNYQFNKYENQYLKNFFIKTLEKEMLTIYLKQIISFNKFKFESFYILPFTRLINKIYNKKVEFNLVNLKYFHLNSHIFTDTIVTKLRNRKNRLLRVLKASLLMFKLPYLNKLEMFEDISNRKKNMQNLKVNDLVSDSLIFKSETQSKDTIDQMLLKLYPENFVLKKRLALGSLSQRSTVVRSEKAPELSMEFLNPFINKKVFNDIESNELESETKHVTNTILNSIKHKFVSGIRLEAAGRLTKRNTAARSVFKLRYKGNIKNMDSSYKGLSSVILRGHVKSNLQYTFLNSKIRIGSFGIKGWVSSN